MSETQAAGQSAPLRASGYVEPGKAVVILGNLFAFLAALGVVFMTLATVYDVLARYFLNSPTTWATEISTYVLIATIFFGAAYTHLADGNVRVSVILARLRPEAARDLGLITAWLGLLYVGVAGWQLGGRRIRVAIVDRHERQWERDRPDDYSYRIERSCFCFGVRSWRVTVEDGRVVSVDPDGLDEPRPPTIEDLFDVAREAILDGADGVDVEYGDDGHPVHVFVDRISYGVDDEYGYKVSELRASR